MGKKIFKVGDKVEAIVNHSIGKFIMGQQFVVTGISFCPVCGIQNITIGIKATSSRKHCLPCGSHYELETKEWLFSSRSFKIVDPSYSNISKELAEKAMSTTVEVDQPLKEIKEPALS